MGEGGAVVTNAGEIAQRVSRLRWFGIDRDTFERDNMPCVNRWRYEIDELGEKAYLDNLHAAIGNVQLDRISDLQAQRARLAGRYREGLADIAGLQLPVAAPDEVPSWHLYQVRTTERDDLAAHLDHVGITTGVHYPLVSQFRALRSFHRSTPNAERISSRLLSLPLYACMRDQDADRVIDGVRRFFLRSA
jgi:dTDP-4-amino-4,6-dideoxygalactose transaminase